MIVGLGNSGDRYTLTRHNVGFLVVAALVQAARANGPTRKFRSLVWAYWLHDEQVLVAQPQTFMNDSGVAVSEIVRFYDLSLADCMVVCDTLDLPPGALRVRARGSCGGHRGLRSIETHLGSSDYPRLRIGIGRPQRQDPVDYVLGRFSSHERQTIEETVIDSVRALDVWMGRGIDACMNEFN